MALEKEKITRMILYVDLKCPCCYKKVRKLLCKFPQIRDQAFDLGKNKVIITVVCCDPERLRDKLCCKGGGAIQSIEIVENKPPPKKTTPDVEIVEDKPPPKKTTPDVEIVENKPPPKNTNPNHNPKRPVSVCCQECYEGRDGGPCHYGYGRPVPHQRFCPPVSVCCQECYEGRAGGPCHYSYGRPVPPPPCYDYYGYQYPSNRPSYVRCDYFYEDNPQGCSIM